MNYKIDLSVDAAGYSRGYYEIKEEALLEALEEAIETENVFGEDEKEFAKRFIRDHVSLFLGDFIIVRDDKELDIFVNIE